VNLLHLPNLHCLSDPHFRVIRPRRVCLRYQKVQWRLVGQPDQGFLSIQQIQLALKVQAVPDHHLVLMDQ